MSRLKARIDRLETAMGRRGPADWRFEDMLAAIHAVMWERTGAHLDPVLVGYVRELLEPDRHLWEHLPITERRPGWADRLKSDDGVLVTGDWRG
jgi:hypothetical protein